MTLAKRTENLEDSLTPKEAVILWMREVHQFGSLENYARWLMDQPDDVYPLIRMPAQVVAAIRSRHKGVPDLKLHPEFYRVRKDVLFLYYLHGQANTRALMDHEAIQLRVIILIKEIRALINEKHGLDQMRLGRVDLEGKKHPRPSKAAKSTKVLFDKHADAWLPEADDVVRRVTTFLLAAQMLSGRYFAGKDILYPDTRRNLSWNLETIANLKDMYTDSILGASPESDDDFRDYVLALAGDERRPRKAGLSAPVKTGIPDVTREAKLLAEQWILMARSETLEKLGEHREAEALAGRLVREHMG